MSSFLLSQSTTGNRKYRAKMNVCTISLECNDFQNTKGEFPYFIDWRKILQYHIKRTCCEVTPLG